MIPASMSATSALVYENCPARWRAEYFDKAPQPSGPAAALGSACHRTLELMVQGNYHTDPPWPTVPLWDAVKELWDVAYFEFFADRDRYDEGLDLCVKWAERTDFSGREVISTEVKENFLLKTSAGEIPFNYIWDRCDVLERHENGDVKEVEVIDYKSYSAPISVEELRRRIQARCYAVAAQVKWPTAERVWVTFDLLRYEPVGAVFTREENRETYRYLLRLMERVIADDEAKENLNPDCRWCIRRLECGELAKHMAVGGPLSISDPHEAADMRARYESARGAINKVLEDLDGFIVAHCEREETLSYKTSTTEVTVGTSSKREIDPRIAARIVGPQVLGERGRLTMRDIDDLLKPDSALDDDQRSQLRAAIKRKFGDPKVTTKAVS